MKGNLIIRPYRSLYIIGLGILGYSWFGWGGVLLVFLSMCDITFNKK